MENINFKKRPGPKKKIIEVATKNGVERYLGVQEFCNAYSLSWPTAKRIIEEDDRIKIVGKE